MTIITEEERRQILKNEEKLWDLAAITIAPTLIGNLYFNEHTDKSIAKAAYDLADALILERRRRLRLEDSNKS